MKPVHKMIAAACHRSIQRFETPAATPIASSSAAFQLATLATALVPLSGPASIAACARSLRMGAGLSAIGPFRHRQIGDGRKIMAADMVEQPVDRGGIIVEGEALKRADADMRMRQAHQHA